MVDLCISKMDRKGEKVNTKSRYNTSSQDGGKHTITKFRRVITRKIILKDTKSCIIVSECQIEHSHLNEVI